MVVPPYIPSSGGAVSRLNVASNCSCFVCPQNTVSCFGKIENVRVPQLCRL